MQPPAGNSVLRHQRLAGCTIVEGGNYSGKMFGVHASRPKSASGAGITLKQT
jgi:hypothetical protein